mmetsp:Transcript_25386/g.33145  ORF Transcript_25386/g.33145 Transcript_25386/m.33145 type:complete len:196 (-) Transcript_25386:266-853(-)|eukprot:CAMPEP_0117759974 /NCGR_PEP_ID=MMETSP0947-20121206/16326_1 /TAXON_ID=44440 /ORGANISM="Chattonella subsalsa, Strain CCMP2191" /LENGTH=195 /DNA_ID=CAMNT_0005580521 /DNA_START=203 /DNA_END=790 /DNA_ORIENTATION=+
MNDERKVTIEEDIKPDANEEKSSLPPGKIGALYAAKLRKMREQKDLSNEMNAILTREGGLNDCSQQTCKNLEVAIAVSQRPGHVKYYQPPPEIQRIYDQGDLKLLTNKIKQKQREIDQVKAEIQQEEKMQREQNLGRSGNVDSLSQWFAVYGQPKPPCNGQMTTFDADPKVYGGTTHHQAFKTLSKTMRKGRVLR